jgi:hypothetical protein
MRSKRKAQNSYPRDHSGGIFCCRNDLPEEGRDIEIVLQELQEKGISYLIGMEWHGGGITAFS